MKRTFYFLIYLIFLLVFKEGASQNPTYVLNSENLHYNAHRTHLEWDIYIRHTNPLATFEYASGQYVFEFRPNLYPQFSGIITYEIVGSDLPLHLQPINPTVVYTGGFYDAYQ